jgi:hypothetical protein
MPPRGMMLVVRALLNSRLEKSTLSPLVLSCPPKNLNPPHSKMHGTSLEQTCQLERRTDNLGLVDGSKVSAVE